MLIVPGANLPTSGTRIKYYVCTVSIESQYLPAQIPSTILKYQYWKDCTQILQAVAKSIYLLLLNNWKTRFIVIRFCTGRVSHDLNHILNIDSN